MLDLLIKNACIVDGSGAASMEGDVGIEGDRIVVVGDAPGTAHQIIDGAGLTLTPGFIDLHTHYDGQVSWDAFLTPSSQHGVTTVLMGNCGVGFAPARPDQHDFLIRLLEGVEDIPGTALHEGITWQWESFEQYLDTLESRAYAIDIGAQMPHAALRTYVMGARGADHTQIATAEECAQMAELTCSALTAGAMGFSTSRTANHKTADGKNIGTLSAGREELGTIAGALARAGRGVLQIVSDATVGSNSEMVTQELDLFRHLVEIAQRPMSFSVAQAGEAPEQWRTMLEFARQMSASGAIVKAQVAPRPIGVVMSFSTTVNPFMFTPTWQQQISGLSGSERYAKLCQPEVKQAILAEHGSASFNNVMSRSIAAALPRVFRFTDPVDYEPAAASSLAAEATASGRETGDYAYDCFLEDRGQRLFYLPFLNYAHGNLDDVHTMLEHPDTLYGLSDGGAHCGTICDASFPTTLIDFWRRGNRSGKRIPLELVVRNLTARNAEFIGWRDRGLIKPGYLADLNIIDLERTGLSPPRVIKDLPANGSRLLQSSGAYRYTIKSGRVSFRDGEPTGELAGRLVRGERSVPNRFQNGI